ncbi:hypothetical protein VU05_04215 [Desulfobulbus sp. F1]|nr:hypothetical protein [Desulfobulbus sp. F1]
MIKHEKRQGLAFAVGKWKGFEKVGEQIGDLHQLRSNWANSKLSKLTKHDCIQGNPESIVHMDWLKETDYLNKFPIFISFKNIAMGSCSF